MTPYQLVDAAALVTFICLAFMTLAALAMKRRPPPDPPAPPKTRPPLPAKPVASPFPAAQKADPMPDIISTIEALPAEIQAQFHRLDNVAGAVDKFVEAKVALAVAEATAALQATHDTIVKALTDKLDALAAKLIPPAPEPTPEQPDLPGAEAPTAAGGR